MPSAMLSGIVTVNTTPTLKKVMPLAIQAPRAPADPLRSGPDSDGGCSLTLPTITAEHPGRA